MCRSTLQRAFRLALKASGVKKAAHIHSLRHSYATHMLDAGTSLRQISAYLGHTTLKPTLVYLHLTEISETKARDALRTLPGV